MSHSHNNPIDHPEVQLASAGNYLFAYGFALGAMLIAFWMVVDHIFSPLGLIVAISLIALATALVQFYFLFKLDLSSTQIWHTISLVMIVPLLIMAIVLTIWMFHTLMLRTMLPGM